MAVALRLLGWEGLHGADEINYIFRAREIALGTFELKAHPFWNRWGLLLPEALLYLVFGPRLVFLVLYPFLAGLLLVYLTYLLGVKTSGRKAVGVISALLVAALPVAVRESTHVVSDLPCTAFISLSLILILYAFDFEERRRIIMLFCSGLCLGWAYLTKEGTVAIFPVYAAFLLGDFLFDRKRVWSWCPFVLGAVLFPLAEALGYYFAVGNPFFRYASVDESYNPSIYARGIIQEGKLLRRLFLGLFDHLLTRNREFGYLFLLAAAGTVSALFSDNRGLRRVAVWLWLFLLTFNFISTSVTEYLPLVIVPRYLLPSVPPAAVLAALVICQTHESLNSGQLPIPVWRGTVGLLVASLVTFIYQPLLIPFLFLVLTLLVFLPVLALKRGRPAARLWRAAPIGVLGFQTAAIIYVLLTPHPVRPFPRLDAQALALMNRAPDLPVFSDHDSIMVFQFLDQFRHPARFVDCSNRQMPMPNAGFLWKHDHRLAEFMSQGASFPPFMISPPAQWEILFQKSYKDDNYTLYRITPPP